MSSFPVKEELQKKILIKKKKKSTTKHKTMAKIYNNKNEKVCSIYCTTIEEMK